MERLWDDITAAYDRHIQVPGKETHFLILLAFVLPFSFIRTSAHMIRAQVSWWPGNVETKSGTHVHHLVWGILLLLSMGYIGISTDLESPWFEFVAIAFGIGMGLTMDEFALWLNLQDVYWTAKGRQSIDAVIVTTGAAGGRAGRVRVLGGRLGRRAGARRASTAPRTSGSPCRSN